MEQGVYSKKIIISADYCDCTAALSAVGAFTVLQNISGEHAEVLGIGVSKMSKQGKFWVTAHNRIDFYSKAWFSQEITAETWAEPCGQEDMKCYRSYLIKAGDKLIAMARTQWAILGPDGKSLPFRESGFPADYQYADRKGITDEPVWFEDDFTEDDLISTQKVLSTDIDFVRHMNNVAYVKRLLDQFKAEQITASAIRSMEIHYSVPCLEGEDIRIYRKNEGGKCRMAVRNHAGRCAVMASITFNN